MATIRFHRLFLIGVLFGAVASSFAADQTTALPSDGDPPAANLADRQAVVRDRVARLEDRMFQISQAMKKAEPEKAAQLLQALGASRSMSIRQKMDEIVAKLQANQLSDAADGQKEIAADLQALLKMLLEDPNKLDDRREEINRLEEIQKNLDEVIKEQSKEKRDAEAKAREMGRLPPASQPSSQPGEAAQDGPAPDLGKQAECQRSTTEKTKGLLKKMKDSSKKSSQSGQGKSGEQEGGQEGDQKESESKQQPTPGTQDVHEAVPSQEKAAGKLDSKDPKDAAENQKKALEKLEQAKKSLSEKLQQLRKEQQEQLLAALESRFRAMLTRQLECNKATGRLSDIGKDNWSRSDQLELSDLSQKEKWVADEADKALYILKEEGTTVVFPQIVEQVRDDARDVSERLAASDAGASVRSTQETIAQTLKELLDAIMKKQAEDENDPSNGDASEDGPQPLLPGSAELKLLRACQLRVNRATLEAEKERHRAGVSAKELSARIQKLVQRQQQVHDMAKAMHESLTRPQ